MNNNSTANTSGDPVTLKSNLIEHLQNSRQDALPVALPALNANPQDPEVLLLTIIAALFDKKPDHALRFLQRFQKKWVPLKAEVQLLRAIAFAEQDHLGLSAQILKQYGTVALYSSIHCVPLGWQLVNWFSSWLRKIERYAQQNETLVNGPKNAERKPPARDSVIARDKRESKVETAGSARVIAGQPAKKVNLAGTHSE